MIDKSPMSRAMFEKGGQPASNCSQRLRVCVLWTGLFLIMLIPPDILTILYNIYCVISFLFPGFAKPTIPFSFLTSQYRVTSHVTFKFKRYPHRCAFSRSQREGNGTASPPAWVLSTSHRFLLAHRCQDFRLVVYLSGTNYRRITGRESKANIIRVRCKCQQIVATFGAFVISVF